jgi:hypothetical protein
LEGAEEEMRTVWIYTDPSKQAGDVGHLIVFESPGIFERWKQTNDPEALAFECLVIGDDLNGMSRRSPIEVALAHVQKQEEGAERERDDNRRNPDCLDPVDRLET